jgi:3-dehydro-4-phosphotetronate decarboxylase
MTGDIARARKELQEAGRFMVANGLTWGNAGNLSVRLDETGYLITASGTRLAELTDEDFVVVPISPGPPDESAGITQHPERNDESAGITRHPERSDESAGMTQHPERSEAESKDASPPPLRKPSKERPMHAAVYQERPEINAVLHGASFYATLVACSDAVLPSGLYVEDMYYLERVARVPYAHPGSAALGEGVRRAARGHNVLLLENHGVLAFDTGVQEALLALQVLEMTCRMVVTALSAGLGLQSLPGETVKDFLTLSGYRPRRKWQE